MEELVERYKSMPGYVKFGILLIICGFAGYYSFDSSVTPAKLDGEAAIAEQATLEQELGSISAVGQSIVAVESEIKKADDEINSLIELLPVEPNIERLLGVFSEAAKESNVEFVSYVPNSVSNTSSNEEKGKSLQVQAVLPQASGAVSAAQPQQVSLDANNIPKEPKLSPTDDLSDKIAVTVNVKAEYPKIVTFLDKITSLTRVVRVNKISLKAENQNESSNSKETSDQKETNPTTVNTTSQQTGQNLGDVQNENAKKNASRNKLNAEIVFLVYSQKLNVSPHVGSHNLTTISPAAGPMGTPSSPTTSNGITNDTALSAKAPLPAGPSSESATGEGVK